MLRTHSSGRRAAPPIGGASFLPEVADHEVLWGLGLADGEPWTGGASVFCHHPGTGIVKQVGTARGHALAVSR